MEVIYDGIRLTAEAIAAAAAEKRVHVVGLSILSGSHLPLVQASGDCFVLRMGDVATTYRAPAP